MAHVTKVNQTKPCRYAGATALGRGWSANKYFTYYKMCASTIWYINKCSIISMRMISLKATLWARKKKTPGEYWILSISQDYSWLVDVSIDGNTNTGNGRTTHPGQFNPILREIMECNVKPGFWRWINREKKHDGTRRNKTKSGWSTRVTNHAQSNIKHINHKPWQWFVFWIWMDCFPLEFLQRFLCTGPPAAWLA